MGAGRKETNTMQFGSNAKSYPSDMRVQLWPLCCGATILSGFKDTSTLTPEALVQQIKDTMQAIPDHQVFAGETITPKTIWVVLNGSQCKSPKITGALETVGFREVAECMLNSGIGKFYVYDGTKTFKITYTEPESSAVKAA